MKTSPITLKHLPIIEQACTALHAPFSEHTFGNLFLYRKVHDYSLIQDEEVLLIKGISYEKVPFLMPLQNSPQWDHVLSLAQQLDIQTLYPIDESAWPLFQERGYQVTFHPNDSDYLFTRTSLEKLSGRVLAKKKNLYSQFVTSYNWKCTPLNEENFADAALLLDKWYSMHPEALDKEAMYDGLRFFNELQLMGFITYVDMRPVGIYYGEKQKPSTFVVHAAKALPEIKGLGAFVQIEGARKLSSSITLLNWEQDLGLEGLRQAKYTFAPTLIRKKGLVSLSSKS